MGCLIGAMTFHNVTKGVQSNGDVLFIVGQ
jgi:hypothetical protein